MPSSSRLPTRRAALITSTRVASGFTGELEAALLRLLGLARARVEADTAVVLLLDASGSFLDTIAADGLTLNVRQRARVRVGKGFAGSVAASQRPVVLDHVSDHNVVNPLLLRQGVQSLLGVPLLDGEDLLGVLHVGSLRPRHFTDGDVLAMQGLAGSVTHTLRQHLLATEQSAAAVMQRSLVPTLLPEVAGLDLASRYLPAEGQLGGDWFDVFFLPGQRLGLVMGDVLGHGLGPAIVMGRMRSALRAYALEYPDPAQVLSRLNAKFCHFEPGAMATVLYAVTEPPYEQLWVSLAGHPSPILLNAGPAVTSDPDLPIGVNVNAERRSEMVDLPAGVPMLLFTDGLIERRTPGVTERNRRALAGLSDGTADQVCSAAINLMFEASGPEDDAALLVLRRADESPPSAEPAVQAVGMSSAREVIPTV